MDPLFVKLLREQLMLSRDMKVQYMTETRLEHDEYMHSLGYLEALRRVEQMIEEVNSRED